MTYWAYCDPDKKRSPSAKLKYALVHYEERHGHEATCALVHCSLVALIPRPPVLIEGRAHVPPHTFLLGVEEGG